MMSPEDVLIEAIQVAARHGDSPELRERQTNKLKASLLAYGVFYIDPADWSDPDSTQH